MRIFYHCGGILDGKVPFDGSMISGVPFASILHTAMDLIAGDPTLYGYLHIQVRTRDVSKYGKIVVVPVKDVERCAYVFDWVPNIHAMTIGRWSPQFGTPALLEMLHQDCGIWPIHAIFNADLLAGQSWIPLTSVTHFVPPIIARAEDGIDRDGRDFSGTIMPFLDADSMSPASRMLMNNVFFSKRQMSEYARFAGRWFKPAAVKTIMDRSAVLPNMVDATITADLTIPRRRTVGSFGMMNTANGTEEIFKVYEQLFRAGKIEECVVTTQKRGSVDPPDFAEFHCGTGRSEYLKVASRARVQMINVEYQAAFCIIAVEVMLMGVVPVLPNRPWIQAIVPDDWPFVFNDKQEAAGLILKAMDEWETWAPFVQEYAKRFDKKLVAPRYTAWIGDILRERSKVFALSLDELRKKYKIIGDIEQDVTSLGKSFTWSEFLSKAGDRGRNRMGIMFGRTEFYEILNKLGFVDDLSDVEPHFVQM